MEAFGKVERREAPRRRGTKGLGGEGGGMAHAPMGMNGREAPTRGDGSLLKKGEEGGTIVGHRMEGRTMKAIGALRGEGCQG